MHGRPPMQIFFLRKRKMLLVQNDCVRFDIIPTIHLYPLIIDAYSSQGVVNDGSSPYAFYDKECVNPSPSSARPSSSPTPSSSIRPSSSSAPPSSVHSSSVPPSSVPSSSAPPSPIHSSSVPPSSVPPSSIHSSSVPPSSVPPSSVTSSVPPSSVASSSVPPSSSAVPSAAAAPDMTTDYINAALIHHNIHRSNHSAPNVIWDTTLYQIAKEEALNCDFSHNT